MSTEERPAAAKQTPDVVLVGAIDYQALEPGVCGRCLRETQERRTHFQTYADLRPAAMNPDPAERQRTCNLLCQHHARRQRKGELHVSAHTAWCPTCLEEEMVGLGFPGTIIRQLRSEDLYEPEPPYDAAHPWLFALFMHFVPDAPRQATTALVSVPTGESLEQMLAAEREQRVSPDTPRGVPLP